MDESGIDRYLFRNYGRARRGELVEGVIRGRKFERTSIVAGKLSGKIIAPLQYKGSMYYEFFEYWFINHLIPVLPQRTVIVMDNASFHRKEILKELANKYGHRVIFLPPYSPELNPIEHFWNWLKKKISDLLMSSDNLNDVISTIFQVF